MTTTETGADPMPSCTACGEPRDDLISVGKTQGRRGPFNYCRACLGAAVCMLGTGMEEPSLRCRQVLGLLYMVLDDTLVNNHGTDGA